MKLQYSELAAGHKAGHRPELDAGGPWQGVTLNLLKASEWSARFTYPWDNLIFGIADLYR